MNRVFVAAAGCVPVTRNVTSVTIEGMASKALHNAFAQAGMHVDPAHPPIGALYVGNMLSGMLSHQQNLGPLITSTIGLAGIESWTTEGCSASGAMALRAAFTAVAGGIHETVAVVGVEHMTHRPLATVTSSLATASDWRSEGSHGQTFVSLNAKVMQMYMQKYHRKHSDFGIFSLTAHDNALTAEHATIKKKISREDHENARTIVDPVGLLDASPVCDGAAAVILTSNPQIATKHNNHLIRIAGSAVATDDLALHNRHNVLHLKSCSLSSQRALQQSCLTHKDINIFELHDAYSIMACLCLESSGFCEEGQDIDFALNEGISLCGSLPIATFGGLKARGHPVGASGVYQAYEVYQQLTLTANKNQVKNAKTAMTMNLSGTAAAVVTHVFVRE